MMFHKSSSGETLFIERPEDENKVFNRNRFLRNLFFSIKQSGKKMGELESEIGVSAGYISRLGKGTAVPSVEVIMKLAEVLNISVDMLLKKDIDKLNDQEKYLMKFLNRLNDQTLSREVSWEVQTAESLRSVSEDVNGNATHPLFTKFELEEIDGVSSYPNYFSVIKFLSNAYERQTEINGDSFRIALEKDVDLYIMNVSYSSTLQEAGNPPVLEVWLDDNAKFPYFLCGTQNAALKDVIESLYQNIKDYSKFPSLTADTLGIIDNYMKESEAGKLKY